MPITPFTCAAFTAFFMVLLLLLYRATHVVNPFTTPELVVLGIAVALWLYVVVVWLSDEAKNVSK